MGQNNSHNLVDVVWCRKNQENLEKYSCRTQNRGKSADVGVGSENQGHKLVDQRQATQVVKSGDQRSCHAPTREGQLRHVGLRVEALEEPDDEDFCIDRELRLRQSWWSVHAPE